MTVADTAALIGTASIAGAVAGFYYTTQHTDLRASVEKKTPHGDDKREDLRRELIGRRTMAAIVLLVHVPLTVLFVVGAAEAIGSIDPNEDVKANRVAVTVLVGLSLLHGWTIFGDLRKVQSRLRYLAKSRVNPDHARRPSSPSSKL